MQVVLSDITRKSFVKYASWQGIYVSKVYKEGKVPFAACLKLYAGTVA